MAVVCAIGFSRAEDRGASSWAAHTVILANRRLSASVQLARDYAALRGIDPDRICTLNLPTTEHISRDQYERRLRDPLLDWLRAQGLVDQLRRAPDRMVVHDSGWETQSSDVWFLVSTYGVPVHIHPMDSTLVQKARQKLGVYFQSDEAAVDSELSLLLSAPYRLQGPTANPRYRALIMTPPSPVNQFMLWVGRLDGPDPDQVLLRVREGLEAEYYGLHGRAYFDTRGLKKGVFVLGDYWIAEAAERFSRYGFDTVMDRGAYLWGESFPVDEPAVYMGWYTEHVKGPWAREENRFVPGAIAYHLHSAGAREVRSAHRYWVGPLLSHGAAVTMGPTAEPYLQFTPELNLFADRLCRGLPFGAAACMAMPSLSWQMTVLGDPLYAPFSTPLEQQIQRMEADDHPMLGWAYRKQANRLLRNGQFNPALQYVREKLRQRDDPVLREKLADMYAVNHLFDAALKEYAVLLDTAEAEVSVFRYAVRFSYLGRVTGNVNESDVRSELEERYPESRLWPWYKRTVQQYIEALPKPGARNE